MRRGSRAAPLVHHACLALAGVVACLAALVSSAKPIGAATVGTPVFGVSEDASKYAKDGGQAIDARMTPLGLTTVRWIVAFNGDPTTIVEKPFLDRSAPVAAANGVHVIVSLVNSTPQTPDPHAFCQWAALVASTYPTITSFVVGNEVNATRFWSPQHTSADPNAGPDAYEATLAQCYDSLKAVNPSIQVIGFGLAPRAVDSNSTKPLAFVRAVGAAYRASGRTTPIMDLAAVHPYPNPNSNPPPPPDRAAYDDPDFFGITQLDRVKQALYDAFSGTAQPTPANGLKLIVDEIGYQTAENGNPLYTGTETSPVVTEAQQATYYARVVQLYACDPSIAAVLFFHLVDETNLNSTPTSGGWQSGLEHPDGSPKPSSATVAAAISAGCVGSRVVWAPATSTTTTTKPSGKKPTTSIRPLAKKTSPHHHHTPPPPHHKRKKHHSH